MTTAPRPCARCHWNPAVPGEIICWTCAIGIARRHCPHDGTPMLAIYRTSNGYSQPRMWCHTCHKRLGAPKLRDVDPARVELHVRTAAAIPACARCGRTDAVEIHHWAPWHLFQDADDWPKSPLCPDCHRLWHVTTGTAGTAQPRTTDEEPAA